MIEFRVEKEGSWARQPVRASESERNETSRPADGPQVNAENVSEERVCRKRTSGQYGEKFERTVLIKVFMSGATGEEVVPLL